MRGSGMRFNPTIDADDDAVSVIFNTTYGFGPVPSSTVIGDRRGSFQNHRLILDHIKVGNQAVTISFKKLVDGAWVADPDAPIADGTSLTASTTHGPYNWYLAGGEKQCYLTNGGTGPDDLDVGAMLTANPNPGA